MHIGKFTAKYIIPIGILVFIAIFVIGVKFFVIKVGVDQVGVRTIIWGVKRGIVQRDYGPGWHRAITAIDQWDLYDSTVQTLELAKEPSRIGHDERKEAAIRTADDYDVSVDMVVKYQIKEGEAWKLRQDLGTGERYKVIVENETRDVARSIFGRMVERDLYNPDEKRKRAEECKIQLMERLSSRHVNIIDVLILEMRFDPQLERKIKNIKLAELDNVLNKSKALAAEERGITQTIEADTEALAQKIVGDKERAITVLDAETTKTTIELLAEADKYLVQKKAEADLYKQQRIADGTLLIKKSQAEGEGLRREALSGLGGDIIIAMEAARNMNLADVNISSLDLNLLDVDDMATRLGVTDTKGMLRVDPKTFKQIQEMLNQPKTPDTAKPK
ncbi:MAG: B-cell receptor associated protein-related protein [Candidatus Jettenia ecosi]|uniref:B-cell receptor associated protein-related protein n=1 Tax=Candidatus Jettenia ecosi TaxID=2494326 RepID=A0A533Q9N9_9BACT|nr:MAG: B-cell receptor associated protein-related protein [Candidatus Jettenia ecosi]